ncbi:MAG: PKD domain-containing protein [bacterium]
MRRLWIGLLTLALAACGDVFEAPARLPLGVALSAEVSSVAVGDTVEVAVRAQGSGLQTLAVDFGDGAREGIDLGNAVLVEWSRRHSYSAPGSYLVTATAVERTGAMTQDTVRIEVSEGDDQP